MVHPTRFDRVLETPKPAKAKKAPQLKKVPPKPPEPELSFNEKLDSGYYKSKLPYPSLKDPERGIKRQAYQADDARLYQEFKQDMFKSYGVENHPKVEVAWRIAWDHGHASGYSEVDLYFSELAELLS